jgi:methionyl aminopeptidase
MTIAIEPMISLGKGTVNQMDDDSFVTRDGSLAAHAEHTVLITEGDAEVLTR